MKTVLMTCMLLVFACGATATPTSWDFQWVAPTVHQSTVGNPRTDAEGNQWSIYSTSQSVTWGPVAWTAFHGYINGGYKDWLDPTEQNDFYVSYLQDNGHGYTGNDTHSALAFDPAVAGQYSMYGGLYFRFPKGNGVAGLLSIGIKNGSAYTALYQTATTAEATIMLSAVPALQNITLGAGDELVMINEASWWTGVQMFISSDTGGHVGVALVPEPATMILLGVGGLLSLRRRK